MINVRNVKGFCKDDLSLIENYEIAVNDKENVYDCHHRKGLDENMSMKELKSLGLYWHRPAEELIFLTHSEHASLHSTGRHPTEETLKKLRESQKGKIISEETRKKLSESLRKFYETHESKSKGTHHTEETKKKLSEHFKGRPNPKNRGENNGMYGKEPWNKGKTNVYSEEQLKRMSEAQKGHHHTEEARRKIAEASRNRSEETKRKMSESIKLAWKRRKEKYNNNKQNE